MVGRELLLPEGRREFGDAVGGMVTDPLQSVDEVDVRIQCRGIGGRRLSSG
jgi:hypothetical protein